MLSASRAAYDLSEQRKSAFKASEIVVIKLLIDRNDSRKRNIFKVQALCDHLSADEYIIIASRESIQALFVSESRRSGIGIHTHDTRSGHGLFKLVFYSLSPESGISQRGLVAGRALLRKTHGISAVMAHQSAVCRMIGHGNTAIRTGHNLAARSARDKCIIAATVYQHY